MVLALAILMVDLLLVLLLAWMELVPRDIWFLTEVTATDVMDWIRSHGGNIEFNSWCEES